MSNENEPISNDHECGIVGGTSSHATNEDVVNSTTCPKLKVRSKRIGKRRAPYWDDFKEFSENGNPKAECKFCKKQYYCHPVLNGSTAVRNHWLICSLNPKHKGPTQSILNLQSGGKSKSILTSWQFNQEDVRNALAYMLIVDELPFKFVEGEGFKRFVRIACPMFVVPSRWTVARDCFNLYTNERTKLKAYFKESNQRICLTTDTWTSIQKINYMCLTAHYIDDNWKLKKNILNFCPISSHKGEVIGREVESCLNEWGIDKIFTITVDNASSNDVAISYLSKKFTQRGNSILQCKYLHMRCIAHIINLVVVDGLKMMSDSVARIRRAISYVRQSPARFQKFKACVLVENIQCKKLLCLDVSTHWNSTYLMLDTAQRFETAFDSYHFEDNLFRKELEKDNMFPSGVDWSNVRRLCTFLEHFYELTLRVSGSLYVTSNKFFEEIASVDFLLKNANSSDDLELSMMADQMREKYDKYWGDIEKINMLIFIAPLLDPRQKFKYVEWWLHQLYGKQKGDTMVEKVKMAVYSMFEDYKNIYTPQATLTRERVESSIVDDRPIHNLKNMMKVRYKNHVMETGGCDSKSELDRYLIEPIEPDEDINPNFDLLAWWKLNSPRFPVLSRMVRDVLAVPISTVASESAFSTGGRVLDAFRSSLTPKIAEGLICSQDWFRLDPNRSIVTNFEEELECVDQLEKDLSQMSMGSTSNEV